MKSRNKNTHSRKIIEVSIRKSVEWLFYTLIIIAPLIYYPYITDFSNLPKRSFIQFTIFLICLLWLLKLRFSNRPHFILHPVMIPILGWLFWSIATVAWAPDKYSGITLWFHWFCGALVLMVVLNSPNILDRLDKLIALCVVSAAIVSVIGILQAAFNFSHIPQAVVPGSTFSNKNMAVQFVVMVWPLSLLLLVLKKSAKALRTSALLSGVITLFLIYAKTRSGWAAALFSFLCISLYFLRLKIWKKALLPINLKKIVTYCLLALLCLSGGVYLSKKALSKGAVNETQGFIPSIQSEFKSVLNSYLFERGLKTNRINIWRNSFLLIADHLWPGVGLANWYVYYPRYHCQSAADAKFHEERQPVYPQNDFIQILSEISVVVQFSCKVFYL